MEQTAGILLGLDSINRNYEGRNKYVRQQATENISVKVDYSAKVPAGMQHPAVPKKPGKRKKGKKGVDDAPFESQG